MMFFLLWIRGKFRYIDFATNGNLNDAVVLYKFSFRRGHMDVFNDLNNYCSSGRKIHAVIIKGIIF
jgi:hypothetical protein